MSPHHLWNGTRMTDRLSLLSHGLLLSVLKSVTYIQECLSDGENATTVVKYE